METQTNKGAGLKITPATEPKECASIFEEAQDKLEEKILTELTGWASLTEPSDGI